MVTTNQRSVIDTHTNKRKEAKHNNKDSHQTTGKKAKEEEERKLGRTQFSYLIWKVRVIQTLGTCKDMNI